MVEMISLRSYKTSCVENTQPIATFKDLNGQCPKGLLDRSALAWRASHWVATSRLTIVARKVCVFVTSFKLFQLNSHDIQERVKSSFSF